MGLSIGTMKEALARPVTTSIGSDASTRIKALLLLPEISAKKFATEVNSLLSCAPEPCGTSSSH